MSSYGPFVCDRCNRGFDADDVTVTDAGIECLECEDTRTREALRAFHRDRAFAANYTVAEALRNHADNLRLTAKERP